jgi:hypothetical protein
MFYRIFHAAVFKTNEAQLVYACGRHHQVQNGAVFSARSARPAPWRNQHRFRTAGSNRSSPATVKLRTDEMAAEAANFL